MIIRGSVTYLGIFTVESQPPRIIYLYIFVFGIHSLPILSSKVIFTKAFAIKKDKLFLNCEKVCRGNNYNISVTELQNF